MRWLHLVIGIAALIGFLATGQYMDKVHDHLHGMDDAQRLQFRSTHIYLLFCSLLNIAFGLQASRARGWRSWLRAAGSALILATPFLAAAGFFIEPWLSNLERPYSRLATYGALAGVLLHLLTWTRGDGNRDDPRPPAVA